MGQTIAAENGKTVRKKKYRSRYGAVDFVTLLTVSILAVFGVIMVFSASYYTSISESGDPYEYLKTDGMYVLIGFGLMILLTFVDYHVYFRIAPVVLVLAFGLMAFLIVPGNPWAVTLNQATRWIRIPHVPFTLMPGEISKIAIIFFAARFLTKNPKAVHRLFGIGVLGVIAVVFFFLYYKQPNLSTGITFVMILFVMMLIAGLHWGWLAAFAGALAAGFIGIPKFMPDSYWTTRLTSFMDPFSDRLNTGWQAVQSIFAMARGGLTGVGLGNSVIKALYLPEPMNDYILAIIAEELGFVGCLVLFAAYLFLTWRFCRIAMKAPDTFGMLLATGIAAMVGVQVLLNIAVVTSSMPATGIALPFVSYGGNATLLFMGSAGIMLNIAKQQKRAETEETE